MLGPSMAIKSRSIYPEKHKSIMGSIMRLYRFTRLLGLKTPIEVFELKLAIPKLTDMRNRYEEEVQQKTYRGSDISDDAPAGEIRDKERRPDGGLACEMVLCDRETEEDP